MNDLFDGRWFVAILIAIAAVVAVWALAQA